MTLYRFTYGAHVGYADTENHRHTLRDMWNIAATMATGNPCLIERVV